MFKEGDLVRCIDIKQNNRVVLNEIYLVKRTTTIGVELENFGIFKMKTGIHDYYTWRFKKISSVDMTKKEKFNYIKYKLGIKGDYYGKEEKRTERT